MKNRVAALLVAVPLVFAAGCSEDDVDGAKDTAKSASSAFTSATAAAGASASAAVSSASAAVSSASAAGQDAKDSACKEYNEIKGKLANQADATSEDVRSAVVNIAKEAATTGNSDLIAAAADLTRLVANFNADQVKATEEKFVTACG